MYRLSTVNRFWCERTAADGLFHWRKCYYGLWTHIMVRSDSLKLKLLNDGSVSYKHTALVSQDVNWWTGVCGLLWCFYQLFGLSFWRHPFTAEDPLVRTSCYIFPNLFPWWNKLIYILDGLRVRHFQLFFMFWWTISLRNTSSDRSPDQLEDVVDQTGSIIAAKHSVVLLELVDQSVPASQLVMYNIIPPQVHIKLNPVHLLWQVQHICSADTQSDFSITQGKHVGLV